VATVAKAVLVAVFLAALSLSLTACSCSLFFNYASLADDYDPNYAVAVVQTSRQASSTFIDYYDESLELVVSIEYPYMLMQSPWGKPEIYDSTVYMTPLKSAANPFGDCGVFALDLKTGEVQELDADGGVSNVTANERYVFAAAFGGMGRIDRETGAVLSIEQPGYLFPFAREDRVYVFNNQRPKDYQHGWLFIMDEDLEILETIDFGAPTAIPQTCGFIGDRLYFVFVADDSDMPWEVMASGLFADK
jgi:hypothetical protein